MAYIHVDVDANDFDSEDLIEVLEDRGFYVYEEPRENYNVSLNAIYEKMRNGQDCTAELKELIYETIGRIV